MIPVHCLVKHDPTINQAGDCFRACVASIMEMRVDDVPHFFHDSCDGDTGHARLREWLLLHKRIPFYIAFPDDKSLDDVLQLMNFGGSTAYYVLFGKTSRDVEHCVVCCGSELVHDPAWYRSAIVGPIDNVWTVMLITV